MGATETETYVGEPDAGTGGLWFGGAAGGLVGGGLMGLLMHFQMGIMEVVGGLYTLESVAAGWTFHMIHALLFGLVFSAALSASWFRKYDFGPIAITFLGVAWGVSLWMVAAGLVMPTWMNAVGLQGPMIPNWAEPSGIGHLVYGVSGSGNRIDANPTQSGENIGRMLVTLTDSGAATEREAIDVRQELRSGGGEPVEILETDSTTVLVYPET